MRCVVWAIPTFLRPKALLAADNRCLRQQLVVLQPQPRPAIRREQRGSERSIPRRRGLAPRGAMR